MEMLKQKINILNPKSNTNYKMQNESVLWSLECDGLNSRPGIGAPSANPSAFITHLCNSFNWQIKELKRYRTRLHAEAPGFRVHP